MASNENQLGVSIGQQCNFIVDAVNLFVQPIGGMSIVAENVNEKVLPGFNNCVGPTALIVFIGEDPMGSPDVSELIGEVRRNFDILVRRGKILSDPRNSSLTKPTGAAASFYSQVEQIRDIVRCIEWPTPMCTNPAEYHGIRPGESDGWLMDCYIISISVITQIGRPQVEAPQISTGPWIQLDGTTGVQWNKAPV